MQLKMVSVYDKKTATFNQPFPTRHLGEALREWDIVRKDPQTKFGKNPEDFDLYQVGEFDDETGNFVADYKPQHIATGV